MERGQETTLQTPRGEILLKTHVSPGDMEGYTLDPGIGTFSRYRSILTSKESLTHQAADPETNLCLALAGSGDGGGNIVGYVVRRPPQPGDRWAEMKPPIMYELFGENARGWRNLKLMKPMLEMVVGEPENEKRILYIVGYSWHWDVDETKKTLQEYRETLIHLLTPLGFKQYPTNEPNISLRAENLFMVRMGSEPAGDRLIKKRLTNLLFGIQEDL